MAPIVEHDGKQLLRDYGIVIPRALVASNPEQASQVASRLSLPVAVKAQVPLGGRGKLGAIRFAETGDEAGRVAGALIGSTVRGFRVEEVLIEEKVRIVHELYLAILFDGLARAPVLILSSQGGMDVEHAAGQDASRFGRLAIDWRSGIDRQDVVRLIRRLGIWEGAEADPPTESVVAAITDVVAAAVDVFRAIDATLLEINPLVVTDRGQVVALDAKMDVDDRALYRQQALASKVDIAAGKLGRPPTPLETAIMEQDAREPGNLKFIEYAEGDVGFLVSGGGGSLYVTDRLYAHGLRPANYIDLSGPSDALLRMAYDGVLSRRGLKVVIAGIPRVNVTRVDGLVAQLARAIERCRSNDMFVPVVARFGGAGETEARAIADTIDDFEFYGQETPWEDVIARVVQIASVRS